MTLSLTKLRHAATGRNEPTRTDIGRPHKAAPVTFHPRYMKRGM